MSARATYERDDLARHAHEMIGDRQLDLYEHHQETHERRPGHPHEATEDRGLAVVLTLLAWIEIAIFSSLAVYPTIAARFSLQAHPGFWPYLAILACFAPLAFRRTYPVPVLVATSVFAAIYFAMPWPPTIVVAAPMAALYTVASRYGGRRTVPVVVVIFVMFLAVSALTVSLSYTVAEAVGMLALVGLAGAIGHSAQTRKELFDEIVRARREESRRRLEEERLRIARDVHDIMAHSLTLMTVQADAGLAAFDTKPERSREALAIIGDTGRSTLRDLRSMLEVLTQGDVPSPREPVADLTGLDALVDSVRATGLSVALACDGDLAAVPSAIAVSAYRIVQESLTNVVRHSAATHVEVRVSATKSALDLVVRDDGTGRKAGSTTGSGRGIRGMTERALALGGTLEAERLPEGGFQVTAHIPIPKGA